MGVIGAYHEFLLLSQSLLAQEHDGRLKHEAHRVQFETLLYLTEEIGDVEPLDAAVIQKIARTQVDWLPKDRFVSEAYDQNALAILRKKEKVIGEAPAHLFTGFLVLSEQMVENSTVLFVNSLHLVYVLGHLLHALERLCNARDSAIKPRLKFSRQSFRDIALIYTYISTLFNYRSSVYVRRFVHR